MKSKPLKIVVSGMIAATPFHGGATWAVLQYLLGFQRLGHDVVFVEILPAEALRPPGASVAMSDNAAYLSTVMADYGLADRWALFARGASGSAGLPVQRVKAILRDADIHLNIAGTLRDELPVRAIPIRVYLDLDPAFTQLWASAYSIDMGFDDHHHHVTVGLAVGRPGCCLPTCGIDWLHTLPPVVLEHWPALEPIDGALTTVANWRSYGSIEHGGMYYGQKAHSLRRIIDLPRMVDADFELALAIHADEATDLEALRASGWRLVDPARVAASPEAYRAYIQRSRAELGVAKDGYVAARSGWFSDRSACYLASGRPVIAQDTGFSDYVPTGTGLLAYETLDDLVDRLEELEASYALHCRDAREIAVACLDSDKVLDRLLRMVGAA